MNERQEIINKLVEFLESDTDIRLESVDESLSLREGLGLDSVDLVGIVMRIEGQYHIRLNHGELEQVTTIASLLDLVQAKLAGVAMQADSKAA